MVNDGYKPVRIDIKKAISKAKLRPGFTQAWDALEEEYAALEALLGARKMAGLTQEELADRILKTGKDVKNRLAKEAKKKAEEINESAESIRRAELPEREANRKGGPDRNKRNGRR